MEAWEWDRYQDNAIREQCRLLGRLSPFETTRGQAMRIAAEKAEKEKEQESDETE